jgi:Diaminopimelate decarboxylase
VSLALT